MHPALAQTASLDRPRRDSASRALASSGLTLTEAWSSCSASISSAIAERSKRAANHGSSVSDDGEGDLRRFSRARARGVALRAAARVAGRGRAATKHDAAAFEPARAPSSGACREGLSSSPAYRKSASTRRPRSAPSTGTGASADAAPASSRRRRSGGPWPFVSCTALRRLHISSRAFLRVASSSGALLRSAETSSVTLRPVRGSFWAAILYRPKTTGPFQAGQNRVASSRRSSLGGCRET